MEFTLLIYFSLSIHSSTDDAIKYFLPVKDSLELTKKFKENREQLDGLMEFVNATTNGETEKIKEQADKFVEKYAKYDPKVGWMYSGGRDGSVQFSSVQFRLAWLALV